MNPMVGMVMCTKQMWFLQIAYWKGICNEWWGWSHQNKFTLKIKWYLCYMERKSLVVSAISLLVIFSIYWVLGEIGMAHLRSKDAKQSFDFFDKLQVGSLTKHEVKCAFISLFGNPPSKVFPSYLHCFPRFVSSCICINDGKLMIMNFSLKIENFFIDYGFEATNHPWVF